MAVSKVILNGSTLIDTTDKTVTAGSMLSGITALKNDGTTATGSIATKTSSNLTASGATVTAPAGYYASDASKSVASGTAGTPTASKGTVSNHSVTVTPSVTNTTGYITGGTLTGTGVSVAASELVSGEKTISASGSTDVTNYETAYVAAGSATTPSTSITANPSISVGSDGLITASVSASQSVTPTVSAGYVSSGTAGTVSVSGSNTSQLTVQAAQTITPTTTAQTISSGKYLTGTQTVEAVVCENLTAANIADGVTVKIGTATDDDSVASVTGTHQGGGNLTTKTVDAGDDALIVTANTDIATASNRVNPASHTAGGSLSSTFNLLPSNSVLTADEEYEIFGSIDVIDSNDDILESYHVDTTFIWSTTPTTIVENDENAYCSEVRFSKGSSTQAVLRVVYQKTATYGYDAHLIIREISGYDGLSSVTVNPVKYSETLIKNWIHRSSYLMDIEWPDGVTKIGSYAFASCTYFSPSSLPSTLTRIDTYAFYGCANLALASLPTALTTINSYAFYGCTSLQLTSLPSGVTTIDTYAFYNCYNITLSSLPSNLAVLGNSAFRSCSGITISSVPSAISNHKIEQYTFYGCTGITSMTIPSGFTIIDSYAFYNCQNLATINLPDTITSINTGSFGSCISLLTVSCDGAITSLGTNAFTGSTNTEMLLQSASFPNMSLSSNITYTFGSSTAANACHYLEFVDIGKTTGISSNAFANCYSLETIVLRKTASVCSLGNVNAFTNTPFSGYDSKTGTAYVPSALIASYKTASNWATLYNNGTVTFEAIEGSDYELD